MARDETDREDLLREATALVERIELSASDEPCATGSASAADNIVAGFRLGGALSIFFGVDPVYQFNAEGELRRAYCGGLLYKAAHGKLVSLDRVRTPHEVQLVRRELSGPEENEFVWRMTERLNAFAAELSSGTLHITGQVPAESDIIGRIRTWLSQHNGLPIANVPGVTHD